MICLTIVENDSLYVGTRKNGSGELYKLEKTTYRATEINIKDGITNLVTVNNNDIYAGSSSCLYRINSTTNIATDISNLSNGDNLNGKINTITIATNGNVYIATNVGKIL